MSAKQTQFLRLDADCPTRAVEAMLRDAAAQGWEIVSVVHLPGTGGLLRASVGSLLFTWKKDSIADQTRAGSATK